MRYYKERNGDYLAVFTAAEGYAPYQDPNMPWGPGWKQHAARVATIEGSPSSICHTAVAGIFLSGCQRVRASEVPTIWWENIHQRRRPKADRALCALHDFPTVS